MTKPTTEARTPRPQPETATVATPEWRANTKATADTPSTAAGNSPDAAAPDATKKQQKPKDRLTARRLSQSSAKSSQSYCVGGAKPAARDRVDLHSNCNTELLSEIGSIDGQSWRSQPKVWEQIKKNRELRLPTSGTFPSRPVGWKRKGFEQEKKTRNPVEETIEEEGPQDVEEESAAAKEAASKMSMRDRIKKFSNAKLTAPAAADKPTETEAADAEKSTETETAKPQAQATRHRLRDKLRKWLQLQRQQEEDTARFRKEAEEKKQQHEEARQKRKSEQAKETEVAAEDESDVEVLDKLPTDQTAGEVQIDDANSVVAAAAPEAEDVEGRAAAIREAMEDDVEPGVAEEALGNLDNQQGDEDEGLKEVGLKDWITGKVEEEVERLRSMCPEGITVSADLRVKNTSLLRRIPDDGKREEEEEAKPERKPTSAAQKRRNRKRHGGKPGRAAAKAQVQQKKPEAPASDVAEVPQPTETDGKPDGELADAEEEILHRVELDSPLDFHEEIQAGIQLGADITQVPQDLKLHSEPGQSFFFRTVLLSASPKQHYVIGYVFPVTAKDPEAALDPTAEDFCADIPFDNWVLVNSEMSEFQFHIDL